MISKRPLEIVLLISYLVITGIVELIVAGYLSVAVLTLQYVSGFTAFALVLAIITAIVAALSIASGYQVWTLRPTPLSLVKWAMAIRILLSIFPPGFVGPVGVGSLSAPVDAAVLIYAFTKRATSRLAARPGADDPIG